MYIACCKSYKIVKATLDEKILSAVGTKGSGHLQFNSPMGLCQDTNGNVYVADGYNNRVQVLGPDCSYQKELNCNGFARGVAVDFHGNVHIATASGVEIFDSKLGYCDNTPCGDVAINQENYRFVTRYSSNGRLEVCKPDNSLLHTICGLSYPLGVCLDQSGAVFIADWSTSKVLKYC